MLSNLIKLKAVHQLSSVTDSFFTIYTVTVLSVMTGTREQYPCCRRFGQKMAERVGFEPTCPAVNGTNRFRVDPVTTTSVPLHAHGFFNKVLFCVFSQ